MKNEIKIGDMVDVYLLSGDRIFGEVLYIPNGSGNCWVIQSYYIGRKDSIEYIQTFERISFNPKPPTNSNTDEEG